MVRTSHMRRLASQNTTLRLLRSATWLMSGFTLVMVVAGPVSSIPVARGVTIATLLCWMALGGGAAPLRGCGCGVLCAAVMVLYADTVTAASVGVWGGLWAGVLTRRVLHQRWALRNGWCVVALLLDGAVLSGGVLAVLLLLLPAALAPVSCAMAVILGCVLLPLPGALGPRSRVQLVVVVGIACVTAVGLDATGAPPSSTQLGFDAVLVAGVVTVTPAVAACPYRAARHLWWDTLVRSALLVIAVVVAPRLDVTVTFGALGSAFVLREYSALRCQARQTPPTIPRPNVTFIESAHVLHDISAMVQRLWSILHQTPTSAEREQLIAVTRDLTNLIATSRACGFSTSHGAPARVVDLRDIIHAAVGSVVPMATCTGVSVVAELPTIPTRLVTHSHAVRRALDNLLSNAIRASPHNGCVIVRLETDPPGGYTITVVDQGSGLPAPLQAQLVQGDTVNSSGGMGFEIIQTLLRQIGGTLSVQSSPRGTAITIHLT